MTPPNDFEPVTEEEIEDLIATIKSEYSPAIEQNSLCEQEMYGDTEMRALLTLKQRNREVEELRKENETLRKRVEELENILHDRVASIPWSVKSKRAGDGDNREWREVAEDAEGQAELALEESGIFWRDV